MFANEDNLVQEVSVAGVEAEKGGVGVFLSFDSLTPQLKKGGHMKPNEVVSQVNVYTDGVGLLFKVEE